MNAQMFSSEVIANNLGDGYALVHAEKELFAVYQTIYSNTDIELWYDWNMRLKDTLWSDNCFFVVKEGVKIGGAIVSKGNLAFPFLISPYCDKTNFFHIIHKVVIEQTDNGCITTSGMLSDDVIILSSLGYIPVHTRQGMIRPTDTFDTRLDGYSIKIPSYEDANTIGRLFYRSYEGGIDFEVFGVPTIDECIGDAEKYIRIYSDSNSISESCIIYDGDKPVASCLIGKDLSSPNGFSGVADIGVLPEYRRRGLARFMLKRALTEAKKHSQAMRLFVTIGNPAENLYLNLGFMRGARFTKMRFAI